MSHLHDFPTSYGFSHLFPWSAGTNSPRPMDPLRPGASKSTAWSLRWAPRRAARGSRCEASALETPRWPTRWVPWGPLGPWPGNPGDLDLNSAEEKNSVNLRMIRISMFFWFRFILEDHLPEKMVIWVSEWGFLGFKQPSIGDLRWLDHHHFSRSMGYYGLVWTIRDLTWFNHKQ